MKRFGLLQLLRTDDRNGRSSAGDAGKQKGSFFKRKQGAATSFHVPSGNNTTAESAIQFGHPFYNNRFACPSDRAQAHMILLTCRPISGIRSRRLGDPTYFDRQPGHTRKNIARRRMIAAKINRALPPAEYDGKLTHHRLHLIPPAHSISLPKAGQSPAVSPIAIAIRLSDKAQGDDSEK
jgi:hypothetical protein